MNISEEILSTVRQSIIDTITPLVSQLEDISYVNEATFTVDPIKLHIDYNYWAEYGRGPGKQPPIATIQQWCNERGIDETLAFPIARSIGKNGTIGKYLINTTIKQYI